MNTQVYFIDGPQAVGKDFVVNYLYNRFQPQLKEKCQVLRATDFFPERLNSELRKYSAYNTEERKTAAIAASHTKIFDTIDEMSLSGVKLIFVNRGVLSSLAYNLYRPDQIEDRQIYIRWYADLVNRYAKFVDIHFLTLREDVDVVISRLHNRNDGKVIDRDWTQQLHNNYFEAVREFSQHTTNVRQLGQYTTKHTVLQSSANWLNAIGSLIQQKLEK
ncbi:hypothetical protein [Flavobacterium sp.]|jgi:thymidylate kinase|uniref:hypothetical protein n=1 Tax=Flavobacterium sp. TaxID=239 RepID=UPI0037C02B44